MDGNIVGYNKAAVEALRDDINNTCKNAGESIVNRLENELVQKICTEWFAPEAVTFFEGFQTTVANSASSIQEAFDQFRLNVQTAGRAWAEDTTSSGESVSYPELAALETLEMNLDVSSISAENGNGDVSINVSSVSNIASSLSEIESNIKTDLETLASSLEASTAFLGGNQANAIQDCFIKVNGEISKIFSYLTDGEDSMQAQINTAVTKYGDVATNVSTAFNNATFGDES